MLPRKSELRLGVPEGEYMLSYSIKELGQVMSLRLSLVHLPDQLLAAFKLLPPRRDPPLSRLVDEMAEVAHDSNNAEVEVLTT